MCYNRGITVQGGGQGSSGEELPDHCVVGITMVDGIVGRVKKKSAFVFRKVRFWGEA